MKLKDVLGISTNPKNKQSIWNPKKRLLKEIDITEEDLLNIKLNKKSKQRLGLDD